MDFGIEGRRALVCAASKGLGRGCAEALAREGVDVTILARTAADVERAAAELGALAEFGAVCAFVCSAHAGYLVGQNILIDGGSYPGTS